MKSNRILYLDVVKAIAISLVCVGHANLLVTMKGSSVVTAWIYSFHMPLFMLLSGYFSIHALNEPFVEFIEKKAKQLLIPAIAIPLITVFVWFLIGAINIEEIARNEAIGGMWFLKTLFACYVFVWMVKRLNLSDGWLCFLSIAFACLFPHGYFLQFNWMLIFFWSGYFLKKHNEQYKKHRIFLTLFSSIIFIFAGRHTFPLLLTYHNMFSHPFVIAWQLVSALAASLSVMGLTYYICKSFNGRLIQFIGRIGIYTLGIYGLQAIVLQVVFVHYLHFDLTSLPFWFDDAVIIPCLGIASMLVCFLLVLWLRRYSLADVLLFGGQYRLQTKSK